MNVDYTINKIQDKYLAIKLFVAFVIFALVMIVFYSFLMINSTKNSIKNASLDNAQKKIFERQRVIGSYFKETSINLKSLDNIISSPKDLYTNENIFKIFVSTHAGYKSLSYYDKNGIEKITINQLNSNKLIVTKNKSVSTSSRLLNILTKTISKDVKFTKLKYNKTNDTYSFYAYIAIYENDSYEGVVILECDLTTILKKWLNAPLYVMTVKNHENKFIYSNIRKQKFLSEIDKKFDHKNNNVLHNELVVSDDFVMKKLKIDNFEDKWYLILEVNPKSIEKNTISLIDNIKLQALLVLMSALIIGIFFALKTRNNFLKISDKLITQSQQIQEQNFELEKQSGILSKYVIYSQTDLKGIIIDVSDAFCKISGYTKEELVGFPHNIVRHPEMQSSIFENLWDTIKSGKKWSGEIKNKRKDGAVYWVYSELEPMYDYNYNKIGYISIRHDITSKKELIESQTKLLQSSKLAAMGDMIGNIAHQWRQPLSVISTLATGSAFQKEMGAIKDEKLIHNLELINEQSQYLSSTIDTFRNFIKEKKEFKEEILEERIKMTLGIIETSLLNNHIKLIDEIDYNKQTNIKMIGSEITEVLINIINNARDILVEKNIENRRIILKIDSNEKSVLISLEDNGGGIPERIINQIFEPYFTTKHKSNGTGLGLHMCYKIIHESHNGNLLAKNTQNGAEFIIELPL